MTQNRTIAKNTLFLYFRMMLVMAISLFTSRIVLRELGVSDYGIYSLVGGFIGLFAFLNGAMSSATQRYLTFDLGKGDFHKLKKTFNITLAIHFGIALLVLLLAETIGLWFLNNKMVFPPERCFAVNIVYQFSVATSLLGIIQTPYNALIIAHEKMNIYAYVGIAEVLLKLLIVFMLVYFGSDKLINYAILTFIVAVAIRLFYQFYCRKHYPESRFRFYWDKVYYNELISYSGWNLFGALSLVARGQGNNIVLNLFFGTTVNAAYGITGTVSNAINSFVNNFQTASNPQIVKLYASDKHSDMRLLVNRTSRFSYFLSIFLMAPVFLNITFILDMWLITPPKYSDIFIRIALIYSIVDTISRPLMTAIQATGKIKTYQIVVGLLVFLNLPMSYIFLKFNLVQSPTIVFQVWLAISVISLLFRLFFLKKTQNYPIKSFFESVLFPIFKITIMSVIVGYALQVFIPVNQISTLILQTLIYCSIILVLIIIFGLQHNEKQMVYSLFIKFVEKQK